MAGIMKDGCYTIGAPGGGTMEVMVKNGELWFDTRSLSPQQRAELLLSREKLAFEPTDEITYVRASYFARMWPEFQRLGNELARKLKLKLPRPESRSPDRFKFRIRKRD
jgi:hypothetical protein